MYSQITLAGNLGRDPEMRYLESGSAVTSFSVATNRKYKNKKGDTIKETTWYRVSAWGRQAETCNQYLRKGSKVLVEGRLTPDPNTGGPRIWTGQDGQSRASYEVTALSVVFLSSAGDSGAPTPINPYGDDEGGFEDDGDEGSVLPPEDDIPF